MAILRLKDPGERANWGTPKWLYEHYNERYRFTIDLAAEAWNAKHENFFSLGGANAFDHDWEGRGWLNPTYNTLESWVARTVHMVRQKRASELVTMLLPVRTSRPWFQVLVLPFAHIEWLEQRVSFDPPPGWTGKRDSPAEDSMIATFERPWMPRGRKAQREASL